MTYLTVFILTVLRASHKSVISAKLSTQSLIGHIEPFHVKQTDVLFKLDLSYFITNVYSSACPMNLKYKIKTDYLCMEYHVDISSVEQKQVETVLTKW